MSAASCSFDRRVDRLQDALALTVTWPRGRKVLSVGNPTSLKPRYWRGERTRLGTHQIRPEGVASRRTVGWPNPTGETPGTHQRDRRRLSFDARGIPVSVKSRVWKKRGEEETSEQTQTMDCAENPKGETGEGGIKQSGEGKESGRCGNVELSLIHI